MELKVLLPFRTFSETKNIKRIVMETKKGTVGLLPQRIDCVAAIVPSIFTYETEEEGIHYLAIDEGVLVKAGDQILLSVHNAIGGPNSGGLQKKANEEFTIPNENFKKQPFYKDKKEK